MDFIDVITNAKTGEITTRNFTQQEIDDYNARKIENERFAALAELAQIDAASIRAMREYIASKADAPQVLKDKEAAAQVARAKIK